MAVSPIGPAVAEALGRIAQGQTGGDARIEDHSSPPPDNPPRPSEPGSQHPEGDVVPEAEAQQNSQLNVYA